MTIAMILVQKSAKPNYEIAEYNSKLYELWWRLEKLTE